MPPTNDQNTQVNDQPPAGQPVVPPPEAGQPPPPVVTPKSGFTQKLASPRLALILFALVFAGIGGYFIYRSFAASLSNERELVSAFKSLSRDKQLSQVNTAATLNYTGSKSFKSASLNSLTNIAQNRTGTKGTLAIGSKKFPFESRYIYGSFNFMLANASNFKNVLPADSPLRDFLESRDNLITRLDNRWYYIYPDIQSEDQPPGPLGLGCLINVPLVPSTDELQTITKTYTDNMPLSITKSSTTAETSYAITVKNASNLSQFLNGISNSNYAKKINSCINLAFHSNTNEKLLGAAANDIVVNVYMTNNRITRITIKITSPKVTLNISLGFTYGNPVKVDSPNNPGDANGLFRVLINPSLIENNSLFDYKLPTNWYADYCGSDEYTSVNLFINKVPNVAYCAYSPQNRAGVGAFQYNYVIDNLKSTAKTAKNAKIRAKINQSPTANVPLKASTAKPTQCTLDQYQSKTYIISGKRVERTQVIIGNCEPEFDKPGTKYVYYYYSDDNGSLYKEFYAWYNQAPKDKDFTVQFDSLVQSATIKL